MSDALLPVTKITTKYSKHQQTHYDFQRVRHNAQAIASLSMIVDISRKEEDRKVLHMTCCQGAMIQEFPGFSLLVLQLDHWARLKTSGDPSGLKAGCVKQL